MIRLLLVSIMIILLSGFNAFGTEQTAAALAEQSPEGTPLKESVVAALPATEIASIIETLEDPASREKLIRQLKIMNQGQQPVMRKEQVKSAASQTLKDISRHLNVVTESVIVLTGNINNIPEAISWFKDELTDPGTQKIWGEILVNLILTLGFGYLTFFLAGRGLLRFRRAAADNAAGEHLLAKLLRLFGVLILDCIPILLFGLAAYLTLSLVGPRELTRLVALAWINAFIITHGILVLLHFVLAPSAPALRCSGLADETANYLMIWGRRISYVSIYGYFSLQAALLLGFPQLSYEVMLRLLGLLVTVLVIIIILQSRGEVAAYFQRWLPGEEDESGNRITRPGLRNRVAQIWHVPALIYVLLFYAVWALQTDGGAIFLLRATLLSLIVIALIRLFLKVLLALFTRGLRISEDLKFRYPGLEERSNRYLQTLLRILTVAVYFLGALSILQAWGVNAFGWLASESGKVLGGILFTVCGILFAAFLIWAIACSLIEGQLTRKIEKGQNLEASARTRTLLAVVRKALAIVLTVVTSLMVLAQLGVEIAPLLAGAGVLGLAVGFGSQKLVQDVITGIFILLEDQIAVGDVIKVGDMGGVVEAVSIRTVRLRDVAGTVHTIPFSAITIVSNLTKDFSYYVMEVGVAYREDLDEVMQVLRDVGAELQQNQEYGAQIIEPLDVLGVDAFADSAVIIKARIKTAPIKQWWVGREFNRRMKKRFDELGIEIPFPHTTLYFGENKGGGAPPAKLQVESVAAGANRDFE